jgi:hypothetical protein
MKHTVKFFLVALPLALLIGCDLAKFPIDDTVSVKVDQRLVGKWKAEKKKEHATYRVSIKDSMHYVIIAKDKKETDTFDAFLSEVRNIKILNVHVKSDSASGYIFLQILDISPDGRKITLATIKDTSMEHMPSAAMIREHIYNNLNDPEFYGDTTKLRKL